MATRNRDSPTPADRLYGFHAVAAAWRNPKRRIAALYCTRNAYNQLGEAFAAAAQAGLERPEPQILDRRKLDELVPGGAVHQGVALEAAPLVEPDLDTWLADYGDRNDLVVVLDQVTDPQNVGAVLRSAAAFGAGAALVQDRHSPPVTGALAKAASGAVEHVPLLRCVNLGRAVATLGTAGWHRLGMSAEAATALRAAGSGMRTALALGAEAKGLRPSVADQLDALASLPVAGPIASLNVSAAAAAGLYELAARRNS